MSRQRLARSIFVSRSSRPASIIIGFISLAVRSASIARSSSPASLHAMPSSK
ncbi:hypothetical protein OMP38_01335 [Cohnella ginsengisoli]|uniref:Uncharacterized protein n=1 Tax=Cohnella ginsengisoli TaxID=425004 RepID=A0A9X4KCI5_9BACL|nr:hypothetical protein [Cohnella ginsengisoli]MDG0789644.1 hypothetical protein [Cohnella ginsengisoli]